MIQGLVFEGSFGILCQVSRECKGTASGIVIQGFWRTKGPGGKAWP